MGVRPSHGRGQGCSRSSSLRSGVVYLLLYSSTAGPSRTWGWGKSKSGSMLATSPSPCPSLIPGRVAHLACTERTQCTAPGW